MVEKNGEIMQFPWFILLQENLRETENCSNLCVHALQQNGLSGRVNYIIQQILWLTYNS